jgi:hypothetical protein
VFGLIAGFSLKKDHSTASALCANRPPLRQARPSHNTGTQLSYSYTKLALAT